MSKSIILCADDYAINAKRSAGILELINHNRLSATSCMTNMPAWRQEAEHLKKFIGKIDIGLHFNLTEGTGFKGLGSCLLKAKLHLHSYAKIKAQLQAQIQAFVQALGFFPDFIDGHQHVHTFPVIRDVLLDVCAGENLPKHFYIRSVNPDFYYPSALIKNWIIQLSGARQFDAELKKHKILHNLSFEGLYDFAHADKFPAYFKGFLDKVTQGGLIMCHPGFSEDDDALSSSAAQEFSYFMSDAFVQDCAHAQVHLTRGREIIG